MTHEDLVEKVARALHASPAFQPASGPWEGSGRVSERQAARAARAALAVVTDVLREPTPGMLEAGGDCTPDDGPRPMSASAWRDALAASPLTPATAEARQEWTT